MSLYKTDISNKTVTLINGKGIIVINMKDRKVIWVPIYDDWTNGWTPITVEEEKNSNKKNEATQCV